MAFPRQHMALAEPGVLETQTHSQMGLLPKQLWSSQATQGSKDWRARWNLCEQAGEELSTGRSGANCLQPQHL